MFTQEELEYLKQYEGKFKTAIKSNYSRSIPKKDLETMVDIYKRITNKNVVICYHCTASIVGLLRDLGNLYMKEIEVRQGNETVLVVNELEKTVTNMEQNIETEQRKNKATKTIKNGKHKPKQSK